MFFDFSSIKNLLFIVRSQSGGEPAAVQTLRVHLSSSNLAKRLDCGCFSTAFARKEIIHTTIISARSPRGLGVNIRGRSASRDSRGPTSSAKSRCCCRSSTSTSGVVGADFSALRGAESRMEKFTARIKIQTAASPAHAFGCGQSSEDSE